MFGLIYGLIQSLLQKTEYRLLIVGLDNAGKTTTIEKIKEAFTGQEALPPERIVPTVGLNIAKIDRGRATFTFWDLGGQAALRSLWGKYYDEAHGLVYVVDSEDTDRLAESRRVLHEVVQDEALRSAPILILANKQDSSYANNLEVVSAEIGLAALEASGRTVKAFATSALHGTGIREATDWLLGQVRAI